MNILSHSSWSVFVHNIWLTYPTCICKCASASQYTGQQLLLNVEYFFILDGWTICFQLWYLLFVKALLIFVLFSTKKCCLLVCVHNAEEEKCARCWSDFSLGWPVVKGQLEPAYVQCKLGIRDVQEGNVAKVGQTNHFTEVFSIAIEIKMQNLFALIQMLFNWSPQNFV